jgi:hypothetical protein
MLKFRYVPIVAFLVLPVILVLGIPLLIGVAVCSSTHKGSRWERMKDMYVKVLDKLLVLAKS